MGPRCLPCPSTMAIPSILKERSGDRCPVPSPIHVVPRRPRASSSHLCAFALLATALDRLDAAGRRGQGPGQPDLRSTAQGQHYTESADARPGPVLGPQAQRRADQEGAQAGQARRSSVARGAGRRARERPVRATQRLARVAALTKNRTDAPEPRRPTCKRLKGSRGSPGRAAPEEVHGQAYPRPYPGRQRRKANAQVHQRSAARPYPAVKEPRARLAGRIVQMTSLAAVRAENETTVTLHRQRLFSWPTTGRISQTYGCTGYPLNPRRGSCRHFHDGLDIVDGYGTPVRAVAVGVVAYAGWNPWDEGGRAYIVVVVHPDGFVSRYGHMIPTKRVRAGEVVHTGQVIGKMGNTGRSTGTHLHFELLRGGKDVNPLSYLPSGVVKIRVDKTTTKRGAAEKARAQKAKARKKAQVERARARRKAAKAARLAARKAATAAEACEATAASTADGGLYYLMTTGVSEAEDCSALRTLADDLAEAAEEATAKAKSK